MYTSEALRLATVGIDMTANATEEAADRALSSVARKLEKNLSVEFMVNELVAEATDRTNLGNMFAGESGVGFLNLV